MKKLFWRKSKNILGLIFLGAMAVLVLVPLFLVLFLVLKNGFSSLSWELFFELPKPVGEPGGGLYHAIMGTTYMVALGALIGIPWGMGAGIYLYEQRKGMLTSFLRRSIELLSGVPSIVIGMFTYMILVRPFQGFSALAGGVALSFIILPTVAKTTEDILKMIPATVREAALALGMSPWKVMLFVLLRAARSGIMTGILLALARAAGETAPLLFTAFGNMYLSYRLTTPMASLPVTIYNYAISPYAEWQSLAWAGSLVLVFMVFCLHMIAKSMSGEFPLKKLLLFRKRQGERTA